LLNIRDCAVRDGRIVLVKDTISRIATKLDEAAQPIVIGSMRILVALMWLANVHWKVPPNFGEDTGGGLFKYSLSVTRNSPFAPFTWVTEEIILPNFQLFGWFTLIVEILLPLLLLIGYKTKLVSLGGVAIAIPIFLSVIYYDRADEWSWAYFLMIGAHLLLYASDAGKFMGLDGVLEKGRSAQERSLVAMGAVGAVVGALGLFVARSVDFAGEQVKLLGSDAGFTDGDNLVRRWELKFLWFNPLWALLTIAFGILLIVGAKQIAAAYAGAAGFALIAIVIFFMQTFDYVRAPDGSIQTIGTGSNVAFWGALAVGAAVVARRIQSQQSEPVDAPE